MARIPNIFEQLFEAGDSITGVNYTGTAAPAQSDDGHVYRQTKDAGDPAIDGGMIPSSATGGNGLYRKIVAAYVYASDAISIDIVLNDPDGYEYIAYTVLGSNCLVIPEGDYYPILPGWTVKVVVVTSTGTALGADGGKIMLVLDPWFQPAAFNMA